MASDVREKTATEAAPATSFPQDPTLFGGGGSAGTNVHRSEGTVFDCEVEGTIPPDINGAFFRVGPDPQYPKAPQYARDIPFDGEGHASMFRIKDGHVDYRSRWVRNQRWKAQNAARRSLFGMYRNPFTDDPSVQGLSRGTANTQVFLHHGKLLAFKEDSPPVALDPHTLETIDDCYTFGGALEGETYTAHPKIDSRTGDLVGFGYQSRGLASDDIEILSVDRNGKANWHTWAKSPYPCMLHDFAVTEKHIAFLAIPLLADMDQMKAGGLHYSWDSQQPSYFGVMERGGDGKDMRWFPGPTMMCTHVMGAWSEGSRVFVDMDGAEGNQFPFFPSKHNDFDPHKSLGQIRRFSVDLADTSANTYDMEILFPQVIGVLARQDDRYHTLPYRYGYILQINPSGKAGWAMLDHQAGKVSTWQPGPDSGVSEMCFVPRSKAAAEGDGYLIGVVNRTSEHSRSDVVLLDTRDIEAGPIATIKMPHRIVGQIHGFWAFAEDFGG